MLSINGRKFNLRFDSLREAVEHVIETHLADEVALREMEIVVVVHRCVMVKESGCDLFKIA